MSDSALQPAAVAPYHAQLAEISSTFEATGNGIEYLHSRAGAVDWLIIRLYEAIFPSDLEDFSIAAVGGYGRRELFPFSDVDLLILARNAAILQALREPIAAFLRQLWDARIRVGHSLRTLAECGQLHRDNLEFTVSLLDARWLAGDESIFVNLRSKTLPHLLARDRQDLIRNLVQMTLDRHEKHGRTVFHLEPNVKEAPGGLRDYHVARWLTAINQVAEHGRWNDVEENWPSALRESVAQSFSFLAALRCFLHFERGRDDNLLTYELQEKASAAGLGIRWGSFVEAAQWMRSYFLHVRPVYRLATGLLEDSLPPRGSLFGAFQDWRSRLSNADFSVIRGKIFPRSLATRELATVLLLFEMVARHNLELSHEAERWVQECLRPARLEDQDRTGASIPLAGLWPAFGRLLILPHAAQALRAMHRLGFLTALFPEFRAIDALVIRDFYHRYTVDEHSFVAIEKLNHLRQASRPETAASEDPGFWTRKFEEICAELEHPELLALALLFHDVGKGMEGPAHIAGSLTAAAAVCTRLELEPADADTVLFLIARHMDMSAALRRDIFDPEVIQSLAERISATEQLKLLTLFTYLDISAVNPEALTPWKAEMLWRLYITTFNYLSHSLDQDRVEPEAENASGLRLVEPLLSPGLCVQELKGFLAGFPRRYVVTHSPEEIAGHLDQARRLHDRQAFTEVKRQGGLYELTVIARDRPLLFACVTGMLTRWKMNVVKADAFANRAGVILDNFRFTDLFRTLELNPGEQDRLEAQIKEALGKADLIGAVGQIAHQIGSPVKVKTATQITFDDKSSNRCTLLELTAQDRPGLLYDISSVLAEFECNIEVALIDTEAERAIDVFYLTANGGKLDHGRQHAVREALFERIPVGDQRAG